MTDPTASAPAIAPALPNASIDMDVLFANDAAGRTGADLLHGALLSEPVVDADLPPADQAQDRVPLPGDTVTREDARGGWVTIHASWLAEPVKVHGEAAATARVDELIALIPAPTA